jgi:hypothetical protein
MRGAIARAFEGGVWTPSDIDWAPPDAEKADLMARLASLTPQQVRVPMMLSEGRSISKSPTSSMCPRRPSRRTYRRFCRNWVESRTQAVIAASKIELGQWPQTAPTSH